MKERPSKDQITSSEVVSEPALLSPKPNRTVEEGEVRFREIFNSMGEGVQICELIFDKTGRAVDNIILEVNPAYEQQSGLCREKVVGRKITEILPNVEQVWLDRYATLIQTGRPIFFEEYNGDLDKWFDVHASPLGGNRFFAVFSDTTKRKKTEEALKKSEEKYRHLLEYAPTGIYEIDFQGPNFKSVNEATCKLSGYTREELMAMGPMDLLDEESKKKFNVRIHKILAGQTIKEQVDYTVIKKDGTRIAVVLHIKPTYTNGKLDGALVVGYDVTERKNTEDALKSSKALLEDVFASMQEGIVILDTKGNVVDFNEAFARVNRFKDKAETLRSINAFSSIFKAVQLDGTPVPPEEWPISKALQGQSGTNQEFRLERTDTGECWVSSNSYAPLRNQKNEIIGAIQTVRDITENKKSEAALRKSEEQFRKAIEDAPIPIIMHAEDGEVLQVSKTWTILTGYKLEDIRTFDEWTTEAVYGEGANIVRDHIKKMFSSSSSSSSFTVQIRTKTNDVRYWIFNASAIGNLADGRRFVVGMAQDITEQKKAELQLEQDRSRLQTILNQTPVAMGLTDEKGGILMDNGMVWKIWAGTAQLREIKDYAQCKAWWPDTRKPVEPEEWPAARALKGEASTETFDIEKFDGTRGALVVSASPLKDSSGKITGTVWTNQDISESRNLELKLKSSNEELQLARREAEERAHHLDIANKELESFSYSVAHDLRAPLRSINGFSTALNEDYSTTLDEQGKRYLEKIQTSATKMGTLIDDLLRLSRISRTELRIVPIDVTALAERITDTMYEAESERDIKIHVQKQMCTFADADLLDVLLKNLISNAWKYTTKSKVAMITVGEMMMYGEPAFFVRDNGAGFDQAHAEKLFTPFQRLHGEEYPGSGIGLAIAKRIIDRHHGKIWAEGEVGKGATFYFSVPQLRGPTQKKLN